jgi:preprotein translocase subunit SecE
MADIDNKNEGNLPSPGSEEKNKDKKVKTPRPQKKGPGFGARVNTWIREMRSELKKVVWPTLIQVVNNSGIVVVTVILIGAIVYIFDLASMTLLTWVIHTFQGTGA